MSQWDRQQRLQKERAEKERLGVQSADVPPKLQSQGGSSNCTGINNIRLNSGEHAEESKSART